MYVHVYSAGRQAGHESVAGRTTTVVSERINADRLPPPYVAAGPLPANMALEIYTTSAADLRGSLVSSTQQASATVQGPVQVPVLS